MTVNPPEEGTRDLRERLSDIPRNRLVDEVVSRWDDLVRLEGEVANLRRRLREAELPRKGEGGESSLVGVLEEKLRVANTRIRQLEVLVQNEKIRRESIDADAERLGELQEENVRLLRNEEELLLLVLDMEAQIDRLSSQ